MREKFIRFFNDFTFIVSEARHRAKEREGKPDQMLQRLSEVLAQVKVGNTFHKLFIHL